MLVKEGEGVTQENKRESFHRRHTMKEKTREVNAQIRDEAVPDGFGTSAGRHDELWPGQTRGNAARSP